MMDEKNTVSSHDLGNTNEVTQSKIRMLFRDLDIESLGGKCLLAVSKDVVKLILEEVCPRLLIVCSSTKNLLTQIRAAGFMSIRNQFLFLISDTDREDKVLSELEKVMDGENVAIIYNSSKSAPTCRVMFPLFLPTTQLNS